MGTFEYIVFSLMIVLIIIESIKLVQYFKTKKTNRVLDDEIKIAENEYKEKITEMEESLIIKFKDWKQEYEKSIRADSITKSKDSTRGYILQNLLPLLKVDLSNLSKDEINFNDFQALGSPIDFLYFEGLSDGDLKSIKFIEVKSQRIVEGKKPSVSLPKRERQIRDIIKEGKVSWELVHIVLDDTLKAEEVNTIELLNTEHLS